MKLIKLSVSLWKDFIKNVDKLLVMWTSAQKA